MSAPRRFGRWRWPHVEKPDHTILELLYWTGTQLGECIRLDVADVDLLQEQLLVHDGRGRRIASCRSRPEPCRLWTPVSAMPDAPS